MRKRDCAACPPGTICDLPKGVVHGRSGSRKRQGSVRRGASPSRPMRRGDPLKQLRTAVLAVAKEVLEENESADAREAALLKKRIQALTMRKRILRLERELLAESDDYTFLGMYEATVGDLLERRGAAVARFDAAERDRIDAEIDRMRDRRNAINTPKMSLRAVRQNAEGDTLMSDGRWYRPNGYLLTAADIRESRDAWRAARGRGSTRVREPYRGLF